MVSNNSLGPASTTYKCGLLFSMFWPHTHTHTHTLQLSHSLSNSHLPSLLNSSSFSLYIYIYASCSSSGSFLDGFFQAFLVSVGLFSPNAMFKAFVQAEKKTNNIPVDRMRIPVQVPCYWAEPGVTAVMPVSWRPANISKAHWV
jgi:hypothetical protein